MEAKKTLGRDIVSFYHGEEAARQVQADFERQFKKHEDPIDIPRVKVPASTLEGGSLTLYKLLVVLGLAKSNNEARRLAQQGGVSVGPDKQKLTDANTVVAVTE